MGREMGVASRVFKQGLDLASILDRTVAVRIHTSVFGTTRKLQGGLIEVDADPDMYKGDKILLRSKELKAVSNLGNEARNYLRAREIPSPFASGIYLVPKSLSEEIAETLDQFEIRWTAMVKVFASVYDDRKIEAKRKLRSAYNESDYPAAELIGSYFRFEWGFMTFGTPEDLPTRIFQREKEKAQQQWSTAVDEMQNLLRAQVKDTITTLVDRLKGESEDGTKRVIRQEMVDQVNEMLALFTAKNVADDTELQAMIDQARGMLVGLDANDIKSSRATRTAIREGFEQIQQDLGNIVTDAPVRKFRFD